MVITLNLGLKTSTLISFSGAWKGRCNIFMCQSK